MKLIMKNISIHAFQSISIEAVFQTFKRRGKINPNASRWVQSSKHLLLYVPPKKETHTGLKVHVNDDRTDMFRWITARALKVLFFSLCPAVDSPGLRLPSAVWQRSGAGDLRIQRLDHGAEPGYSHEPLLPHALGGVALRGLPEGLRVCGRLYLVLTNTDRHTNTGLRKLMRSERLIGSVLMDSIGS